MPDTGATDNLGYAQRIREGFNFRSSEARCLSFIVGQSMASPIHTTEDSFADSLAAKLTTCLKPHQVGRKKSLLYDLSFDHEGRVTMGVDPDSGEPIRGKGRGFEQDILVYDEVSGHHTSVVPRIVAEVKFGAVTTHDVLVYSEKADRIRRVYPYLRYGFVLGGMKRIPGRILRLGQRFDFIVALSAELEESEVTAFANLMREEAIASLRLCDLLFGRQSARIISRHVSIS